MSRRLCLVPALLVLLAGCAEDAEQSLRVDLSSLTILDPRNATLEVTLSNQGDHPVVISDSYVRVDIVSDNGGGRDIALVQSAAAGEEALIPAGTRLDVGETRSVNVTSSFWKGARTSTYEWQPPDVLEVRVQVKYEEDGVRYEARVNLGCFDREGNFVQAFYACGEHNTDLARE